MRTHLIISIILSLATTNDPLVIFQFSETADLSNWFIVDDVVMGGRSDGHMMINNEGHGLFHGNVSLENNGGFSSIRYQTENLKVTGHTTCKLRLRGDGKSYQFRVKSDAYDSHSYVTTFETSGEWEIIEIDLMELYPSFRGRRLSMDNYPIQSLDQIGILIANKVAETFKLELDWIHLE